MSNRKLLILVEKNGGPDGTRTRTAYTPAYIENPKSLIYKEVESPPPLHVHPCLDKSGEKVGTELSFLPQDFGGNFGG